MTGFDKNRDRSLHAAAIQAAKNYKGTRGRFNRGIALVALASGVVWLLSEFGGLGKGWLAAASLGILASFVLYWRKLKKESNFWNEEYGRIEQERDRLRNP